MKRCELQQTLSVICECTIITRLCKKPLQENWSKCCRTDCRVIAADISTHSDVADVGGWHRWVVLPRWDCLCQPLLLVSLTLAAAVITPPLIQLKGDLHFLKWPVSDLSSSWWSTGKRPCVPHAPGLDGGCGWQTVAIEFWSLYHHTFQTSLFSLTLTHMTSLENMCYIPHRNAETKGIIPPFLRIQH